MVFHDPAGIDRPETRAAISSYLDEIRTLRVASVSSPIDSAAQISADRSVAFAAVDFTPEGTMPLETAAAAMAEKAAALEQSGVEVAFAGDLFQDVEIPASEFVGLLAAAVILLVAFGSVVAMGLPIVTALVGVVASIAALGLWSAVVPTPDFTTQVAMMIGIGVGIDYALFIVTRRTALRRASIPMRPRWRRWARPAERSCSPVAP